MADERGAAYVEFLLAFMPVLLFFMGMVQISLLFSGSLVVQHAANRAARCAVVVLDDDPQLYDGTPRNSLAGPGLTPGALSEGLGRLGFGGGPSTELRLSRRATIELAAALPLVPLAPGEVGSIGNAIAKPSLDEAATYTVQALTVSFPVGPGLSDQRTEYDPNEPVTVRVEYRYRCAIPVVSRIVCPSGTRGVRAEATLTNQGAPYPYL